MLSMMLITILALFITISNIFCAAELIGIFFIIFWNFPKMFHIQIQCSFIYLNSGGAQPGFLPGWIQLSIGFERSRKIYLEVFQLFFKVAQITAKTTISNADLGWTPDQSLPTQLYPGVGLRSRWVSDFRMTPILILESTQTLQQKPASRSDNIGMIFVEGIALFTWWAKMTF